MTKPLSQEKIQPLIDIYVDKKNVCEDDAVKNKVSDELSILDLGLTKHLISKELAIELLEMLCDQLPKEIKLIKEAYERNDIEKLLSIFHKVRGGLGYCGVPRLQRAIDTVYDRIKNVKFASEVEELFDIFYNESDVFIRTYREMKSRL